MSLDHLPTVSAWIHRLARECGEREMVVAGERRLTYAAAEAESGLLARGMLAAGIGKGTIYEYFATKEDIFVAGIREWVDFMEHQLKESLAGLEDPIERLRAVAHMSVELCDPDDPDTARLFSKSSSRPFWKAVRSTNGAIS